MREKWKYADSTLSQLNIELIHIASGSFYIFHFDQYRIFALHYFIKWEAKLAQ